MCEYLIGYPQKVLYILDHHYYVYINFISTQYDQSYLIFQTFHRSKLISFVPLLLELRNKNSRIYSELVYAIDEFDKGKNKYIASLESTIDILKNNGIEHKDVFSIELCEDFYYEIYDGKLMLGIIKDQFPILTFNF